MYFLETKENKRPTFNFVLQVVTDNVVFSYYNVVGFIFIYYNVVGFVFIFMYFAAMCWKFSPSSQLKEWEVH